MYRTKISVAYTEVENAPNQSSGKDRQSLWIWKAFGISPRWKYWNRDIYVTMFHTVRINILRMSSSCKWSSEIEGRYTRTLMQRFNTTKLLLIKIRFNRANIIASKKGIPKQNLAVRFHVELYYIMHWKTNHRIVKSTISFKQKTVSFYQGISRTSSVVSLNFYSLQL